LFYQNNNDKFPALQKFEVEDWPKEDYGEFFEGDSYIILNVMI